VLCNKQKVWHVTGRLACTAPVRRVLVQHVYLGSIHVFFLRIISAMKEREKKRIHNFKTLYTCLYYVASIHVKELAC
jgi:hypothetical protein